MNNLKKKQNPVLVSYITGTRFVPIDTNLCNWYLGLPQRLFQLGNKDEPSISLLSFYYFVIYVFGSRFLSQASLINREI